MPNLDENVKFDEEDSLDFHFAYVYTNTDENSCFIYYQIYNISGEEISTYKFELNSKEDDCGYPVLAQLSASKIIDRV